MFFHETNLWETERVCAEIFKRTMTNNEKSVEIVNCILDEVESFLTTSEDKAKLLIRALYGALENYHWSKMNIRLLERILKMFYKSVMNDKTTGVVYSAIKYGLDVTIKVVMKNLSNDDLLFIMDVVISWIFETEQTREEPIIEFVNLLKNASYLHETGHLTALTTGIFDSLIGLICSDSSLYCLLGNRIFQNLIDRHSNRLKLETPRIYFEDMHYEITVGKYHSEDKEALKRRRKSLHDAFMLAIKKHGMYRSNLESIYTSVTLLLVEVPCGFTSAMLVCLTMNIQESTLSEEYMECLACSHRIHAIVIAILSLVCWINRAEVFYDYLNMIIKERAYNAPFLNPPLKSSYDYAEHHILWNKPELFCEDWEVRYGLWKCFRGFKDKTLLDGKFRPY